MTSRPALPAVLTLALAVPAVVGADEKAPDAKALFKASCVLCHGEDGHMRLKKTKAHDFDDATWQATVTDADLRKTITEGRTGTLMQPFGKKLSPAEIDALVTYIRTFAPKK